MNLQNFIKGLEILRRYYNDPSRYHIQAGHDQFFAYATDHPLSPEDLQEMYDLGWFQPDQDDLQYSPEQCWSAYV